MLKSLSPPQGWRVGARRFAPCLISHIGDFKEPGRKPASATARPSLCEAHAEAFPRSGNCRELKQTGRRAVEGSLCLLCICGPSTAPRLLPAPAALRPGPARSRLAASWPLSPPCGGAAWRGGFQESFLFVSGKPLSELSYVAYRLRPALRAYPMREPLPARQAPALPLFAGAHAGFQ